ncbi:TPA: hypothetical protein VB846_001092 [Streptococcus suis]|nr:hypothetical protein [Streptococcus suis]
MELAILSIAVFANLIKLIIHEKTQNDSHTVLVASIIADIIIVCAYFYVKR